MTQAIKMLGTRQMGMRIISRSCECVFHSVKFRIAQMSVGNTGIKKITKCVSRATQRITGIDKIIYAHTYYKCKTVYTDTTAIDTCCVLRCVIMFRCRS